MTDKRTDAGVALDMMRHIWSPQWLEEHGTDEEAAHLQADAILCTLLVRLGFDELVAAYVKIDKWYA